MTTDPIRLVRRVLSTVEPPPPRSGPPTHEDIVLRIERCERHVDRATRAAVASLLASLAGAAPDSILGRALALLDLFIG
jgi:hypothetical protein